MKRKLIWTGISIFIIVIGIAITFFFLRKKPINQDLDLYDVEIDYSTGDPNQYVEIMKKRLEVVGAKLDSFEIQKEEKKIFFYAQFKYDYIKNLFATPNNLSIYQTTPIAPWVDQLKKDADLDRSIHYGAEDASKQGKYIGYIGLIPTKEKNKKFNNKVSLFKTYSGVGLGDLYLVNSQAKIKNIACHNVQLKEVANDSFDLWLELNADLIAQNQEFDNEAKSSNIVLTINDEIFSFQPKREKNSLTCKGLQSSSAFLLKAILTSGNFDLNITKIFYEKHIPKVKIKAEDDKKLVETALAFYKWYMDVLDSKIKVTDIKIVKGVNGMCTCENIDAYVDQLKVLGLFTDSFLESERRRYNKYKTFMESYSWDKYEQDINEPDNNDYQREDLDSFYWFAGDHEGAGDVEVVKIVKKQNQAIVDLEFFDSTKASETRSKEYFTAKETLVKKDGKWLIDKIEVKSTPGR